MEIISGCTNVVPGKVATKVRKLVRDDGDSCSYDSVGVTDDDISNYLTSQTPGYVLCPI